MNRLLFLALCLALSYQVQSAEVNSEPSKSMQNPFATGVQRSPEFGLISERKKEYLERNDDLKSMTDVRYYRVLSIYENFKNFTYMEASKNKPQLKAPNGFYISIINDPKKKIVTQYAIDLKTNLKDIVSRHFLIREEKIDKKLKYTLEYGPFKSKELAYASCFFIKSRVDISNFECTNILQHITTEEEKIRETSLNSATLGLSQSAINALLDKKLGFNVKNLEEATINVREDEPLGPPGFYVVKINSTGVYTASIYGETAVIPSHTIPITINSDSVKSKEPQELNGNITSQAPSLPR